MTLNRREAIKRSALGVAGIAAGATKLRGSASPSSHPSHDPGIAGTVGDVTNAGIDPHAFLETFDYGALSRSPAGQVVRSFDIQAIDREIEVAPGVHYPAWTYNGQVPGPTLRATEGDLVRVNFTNLGTHPHTIHFHGIHAARMDGVFEVVGAGETFL